MFDINMPVEDEDEGWLECHDEYREGLFDEFTESPEGMECDKRLQGLGWADSFLDYSLQYLGKRPQDMGPLDFDEVVFDLFPRKISTEPEAAEDIVDELRAFWSFLKRQYNVPNAQAMLVRLERGAVGRLKRELSNPGNFGLGKSIVMMGQNLGFDMSNEKGMKEFTNYFNSHIINKIPPSSEGYDDDFDDEDVSAEDYAPYPAPSPERRKPLLPPMTADERRAFARNRKKQLEAAKRRRR